MRVSRKHDMSRNEHVTLTRFPPQAHERLRDMSHRWGLSMNWLTCLAVASLLEAEELMTAKSKESQDENA